MTTLELDNYAEKLITQAGGKPSFKMERGYHWATCLNVNDMVVHGIPTDYKLKEGDRLGVDLGTYYKGFHSDASWSVLVGSKSSNTRSLENGSGVRSLNDTLKFLHTGEKALENAIKQCLPGNHIGHISKAIQDTVEGAGYSCVQQLVGHGIGRLLHEDPEIPCFLRGKIATTPLIKVGLVLAVEVIYNFGKSEVVYENDDGWTIVTRDRSISGLFEHTLAVTEDGPVVLTL